MGSINAQHGPNRVYLLYIRINFEPSIIYFTLMESDEKEREVKKQKAVELLINWSKWLISINFLAATGCIIGLKTAAAPAVDKTGIFFFLAILAFSVSVICSTRFVFLMAQIGLQKSDTTAKHIWLAKLQWILFTLGLLFVLVWIGFMSKLL